MAALGFENSLPRCGIFGQHGGRSDWTCDEVATAVGADAAQNIAGAGDTEGALVAADQRVCRVGRQIVVAAFAVGTELQHGRLQGQVV